MVFFWARRARLKTTLRRAVRQNGLLMKPLCRSYGLDYELINRPPIADRGTDDCYWICGDLLSALRGKISYLKVIPYGGFGNNYHQLVFSAAVSEAMGGLPVFHSFERFNRPTMSNSLLRFSDSQMSIAGGAGLAGQFFYRDKLSSILGRLDAPQYCRVSDQHVSPHLSFRRQGPEDVLCIHIRGGDIFSGNGASSSYVQPPLSFYLAAIAHARETYRVPKVKVIYQDRTNPTVDALEAQLALTGHPFEMHSGTLEEDAERILNSRLIVMPQSTFAFALVLMAHGIEAGYAFNKPFRLQELRHRLPALHVMYDLQDGYIRPGEWKNTDIQRRLMIDYPGEHLIWE